MNEAAREYAQSDWFKHAMTNLPCIFVLVPRSLALVRQNQQQTRVVESTLPTTWVICGRLLTKQRNLLRTLHI